MQEELTIDYTRPVVSLANENLTEIEINASVDAVKCLVLTGNYLTDLSFLSYFQNLQLLHIDSANLNDFYELKLEQLPRLTHVIARMNQFKNFSNLSSSESLELLDVSSNIFDINAESTLTASLKNLKTLVFGLATNQKVLQKQITCSKTNLNCFKLFYHAFIERFYALSQVLFFRPVGPDDEGAHHVRMNDIVVRCACIGKKLVFDVKKADEDVQIKNQKIILTYFHFVTNFQISLTCEEVIPLGKLVGKEISQNTFTPRFQFYPTDQLNENPQDNEIIQLYLYKQETQANSLTNFNIITIEYENLIAILVQNNLTLQLIEFEDATELIDRQVKLVDGLKVGVQRQGEGDLLMNMVRAELEQQEKDEDILFMPQSVRLDRNKPVLDQYKDSRASLGRTIKMQMKKRSHIENMLQTGNLAEGMRTVRQIDKDERQSGVSGTTGTITIDIQHQQNNLQGILQGTTSLSPRDIPEFSKGQYKTTDAVNMKFRLPINYVHYYVSTRTRQQLVSELQSQLSQFQGIQYSRHTVSSLLNRTIQQFNAQQPECGTFKMMNDRQSLFLTIQLDTETGVKQIVFQMQLAKQFIADHNNDLNLTNRYADRYLVAHVFANQRSYIVISPSSITFKPVVVDVGLERNENTLRAVVYERTADGIKVCEYGMFRYVFYRDNIAIQSGSGAECPIQGQGIFKLIVQMVDEEGCTVGNEFESDSQYYKERVPLIRDGTKIIDDTEESDSNGSQDGVVEAND